MALKKVALAVGGLSVYGTGVLAAYVYMYDPSKDNANHISDAERQARFDANSAQYDKDIGMDETMAGIGLMRRFLLKHASGAILEVAAGTGRNLPYYAKDANVLLTDLSVNMLAQIQHLHPSMKTAVMSAEDLTLPSESFDTVIDTFALCSVNRPDLMLAEMQRVCKPGGKILLLEHGRSHYDWLSYVLDKFAAKHAERWGCLWNRDILQIVADAGLEVETVHRFHFGTTYYIVARPKVT
ncbi:hypothetical protein ACHHYP_07494 [Achlya hypogyna]|uniref:Methyltransferase type 11 domain-containing protein n=1 Tax=Achlya hypogyna TaxID=1202772 RepID=A0A1V9ZM25_ACHHY|nr:hypothetical protein ACHHYP_07494 [Achlya hypogyna]